MFWRQSALFHTLNVTRTVKLQNVPKKYPKISLFDLFALCDRIKSNWSCYSSKIFSFDASYLLVTMNGISASLKVLSYLHIPYLNMDKPPTRTELQWRVRFEIYCKSRIDHFYDIFWCFLKRKSPVTIFFHSTEKSSMNIIVNFFVCVYVLQKKLKS